MKPLIEKGVLSWCDDNGNKFMDVAGLEKVKRSGRAYLRVLSGKRLPTLFELTGNPRWDKGGDLYAAYDLNLDGDSGDQAFYQGEETIGDQGIIFDAENPTSNNDKGVKVLSEKSHSDV